MNAHQVASAVNRIVIAKGIVSRKAGHASYWKLREILREADGCVVTVEELWTVVQARIARSDAAKQAAKDAARTAQYSRETGRVECSGQDWCACDMCESDAAQEAAYEARVAACTLDLTKVGASDCQCESCRMDAHV